MNKPREESCDKRKLKNQGGPKECLRTGERRMEFCPGKCLEGEFSTLYPREPAIKSRRSCKADNANMISEDLQGKVAIPRRC